MGLYWCKEGKHQGFVNQTEKLIPSRGYTENKYMNAFICGVRIYYDIYNNGGWNIKDCYMDDAKKFLDDVLKINKALILNKNKQCEYIEKYMDKLIEKIRDKDLTYNKYILYIDDNEKKISKHDDSLTKIIFGLKATYDEYYNRMTKDYKYNEV